MGVTWLRKVRTYGVATMAATLKEALRTAEHGLKVIIADGECQLARQRRVRAEDARQARSAASAWCATRYGVDDDDLHRRPFLHPPLGLPVADGEAQSRSAAHATRSRTVIESCVGCGLCGEVAHAAVLCPSFYRAEIDAQPDLVGPLAARAARGACIGWLGGRGEAGGRMSRRA